MVLEVQLHLRATETEISHPNRQRMNVGFSRDILGMWARAVQRIFERRADGYSLQKRRRGRPNKTNSK